MHRSSRRSKCDRCLNDRVVAKVRDPQEALLAMSHSWSRHAPSAPKEVHRMLARPDLRELLARLQAITARAAADEAPLQVIRCRGRRCRDNTRRPTREARDIGPRRWQCQQLAERRGCCDPPTREHGGLRDDEPVALSGSRRRPRLPHGGSWEIHSHLILLQAGLHS
jgi:hypothetical protein